MIETICDPDLAALYDYWDVKRGSRKMPRRAELDPADFLWVLPHVFIAEIHPAGRFRFRLVGTAICARWNEDYTGKWLDELALNHHRDGILGQYERALRTAAPRFDAEEFTNEHGRYLHYHRLLLPLSEDGRRPNQLLGAQKAIGVEGYQVPLPKWA